jgi:hypothetical protein
LLVDGLYSGINFASAMVAGALGADACHNPPCRNFDYSKLERHALRVPRQLGPDLHELFP